ncbi:MAG: thiamine phosphate synthase [Candidatus Saganbacteria bacterium]|nr:thiamine phosphate synthase [Candidatus Saganbacteria bacterium]
MRKSALRIIDANMNRAMEGIRVVEDTVRFIFDHKPLSLKLKNLRSDLKKIGDNLPVTRLELLNARKSAGDVGADLYSESEGKRASTAQIITSNFKRSEEAVRSLEEYGKAFGGAFGRRFKAIRFRLYDLEKEIMAFTAKRDKLNFDLYVITDPGSEFSPEEIVKKAIAGGVRIVQFRDKMMSRGEYLKHSRKIREITKKAGVAFIVNDHVDIARACDADGVHLGDDDLSVSVARKIMGDDRIIGISVHNIDQAIKAERDGADYIGIGPIFATPSKSGYMPIGTSIIREIKKKVKIPIVAIGGINEANIKEVLRAGAKRAAVIGAVSLQKDITRAAKRLRRILTPHS